MNPQLQLMLQQAIQAYKDGNFDTAYLILQEVLQKDIKSADAFFDLGIAYLFLTSNSNFIFSRFHFPIIDGP